MFFLYVATVVQLLGCSGWRFPNIVFIKHLSDSFHRYMLNVSWENTDFSFNSDGYLVNPSMIIITLDRGRQWDKVRMFFFSL